MRRVRPGARRRGAKKPPSQRSRPPKMLALTVALSASHDAKMPSSVLLRSVAYAIKASIVDFTPIVLLLPSAAPSDDAASAASLLALFSLA